MKRLLTIASALLLAAPALAQNSPATTIATVEAAATTNATSTKATAGILYGFSLCNKSAAAVYFKFYNKASAPTVGTDVVLFKLMIPTLACRDRTMVLGVNFTLGIAYAITGLEANSDTTAVAAGDVSGTFDYK